MKALKELNSNRYYKYVNREWVQPQMTANNVIQNGFMVFSNCQAYYPNTGDIRLYVNEGQGWITVEMYFEKPIKVSKFTFDVVYSSWYGAASSAGYLPEFYGSDNRSSWVSLGTCGTVYEGNTGTINNSQPNTPYKYYLFHVRNGGWGGEDAITIANLRVYGSYSELVEATEDDYDVIGSTHNVKVFELDGKLYAEKGEV